MYLKFFGLTEKPFHTTPNPRFLFSSPSHREALASLFYAVDQRQGFMTLIGEVGVGKTTILRTFLDQLESTQNRSIYIYNPNLTFNRLLKYILAELGQQPIEHDSATMIQQLQDLLIQEYRTGGTIVLLIDEAQNMPLATLENLRMLSNIETTTDKLLQIVLIGQPELETLLSQDALRQLRQRVTIRATIRPLTKAESFDYIQYRLAKAGARSSTVFTKQALNRIIQEAKGIPRRLNILCDNTLLTGYAYQLKPIPGKTVKEVIADLKGIQLRKRKRWIAAAIAAGLFIIAIPWLRANTQFFSYNSPHEVRSIGVKPNVGNSSLELHAQLTQSPTTQLNKSTESVTTQSHSVAPIGIPLHTSSQDNLTKLPTPEHIPDNRDDVSNEVQSGMNPSPHSLKHQSLNQKKIRQPGNASIYAQSSEQSAPQQLEGATNTRSHSSEAPLAIYQIKRGDTLNQLIQATYGKSSPKYIKWVLEHNPHILSPRLLFPGQKILFPRLSPKVDIRQ